MNNVLVYLSKSHLDMMIEDACFVQLLIIKYSQYPFYSLPVLNCSNFGCIAQFKKKIVFSNIPNVRVIMFVLLYINIQYSNQSEITCN